VTTPPAAAPESGSTGDRGVDAKLRIGVLDLGSTSFNLLVADATSEGDIVRVDRQREMLRLGATIGDSGEIPEDDCATAVSTAGELRARANSFRVDRIIPIATAALRDARNGLELAQRIGNAVGTPVQLLSGEQEARLIFAAFAHRVPLGEEITLGIDLGGGSCELATGNRWDITWETTLRIGVTRLHRAHVESDPMQRKERKAIRDQVESTISRHRATVLGQGARRCVASGGTIRALARLVREQRDSKGKPPTGVHITAKELTALCDRLTASTHDERLAMPGIKRNRADLLPAGAVIFETLATQLDVDEFAVCDWGLREGAVLQALGLVDTI